MLSSSCVSFDLRDTSPQDNLATSEALFKLLRIYFPLTQDSAAITNSWGQDLKPDSRVTPFPTTVGQRLCTQGVKSSDGDEEGGWLGFRALSTAGGDNGTGRTPAESHRGGHPLKGRTYSMLQIRDS